MYDRLADLPLSIDGYRLSGQSVDVSSGFERVSTTIALTGGDVTGMGEDVGYEADDQRRLQESYADGGLELAGEYTFGSFSDRLERLELFPEPPEREADRKYRRWGFESAALDLALRQAGTDLGAVLDRRYEPVRFVVSTRLETVDRLDEIRAVHPDAEFKLDPTDEWDETLIEAIASRGGVRILDLKGYYEGTDVDQAPNAKLYRRVLETFTDAIVEDPGVTTETQEILERYSGRFSWDAPITGVDSVEDLPFEPSWLNIKPSRFGTVRSLLETIDYCETEGIQLYGGGQFELDVGRSGIQTLASLFYPDGPNDVAPGGYNAPTLADDLPTSPLAPPSGPGFR